GALQAGRARPCPVRTRPRGGVRAPGRAAAVEPGLSAFLDPGPYLEGVDALEELGQAVSQDDDLLLEKEGKARRAPDRRLRGDVLLDAGLCCDHDAGADGQVPREAALASDH